MSVSRRAFTYSRAPVSELLTITIEPGADLFESILEAAKAAGIRHGTLVSGIGALGRSTFRNVTKFPRVMPVHDEDRFYRHSEGPLELLSLSGWIAPMESDGLYLHAHISASTVENGEVVVFGGHMAPGMVSTWIMVVVTVAVHPNTFGRVGRDPYAQAENILLQPETGGN